MKAYRISAMPRIRFRAYTLSLLIAGSLLSVYGQAPAPQSPPTDTVAPDIPGVVKGGTKVQFLKDGFQGTEGPIALPDGSVIFTETNASRITKIDKDDKTSTFLENTNGSNALAFDSKKRLLSVQTSPGQTKVGVIYPKGSEKTLADNFEGKPFTRPNDLVVAKNGGVYFTEPANGPSPALPPAVYYVPPDGGKAIKIADNITFPNGVQLSRDEKILYVNDARGPNLLAFDIQKDGTVQNRRNFAKYQVEDGSRSGADGLAIDSEGRLYAATSAGIEVFGTDGKPLGTIKLSRVPQNLAFAGPDKKTLYVVGRGAAFKIQMLTAGFKGRAK
jgi:gluconolactonase